MLHVIQVNGVAAAAFTHLIPAYEHARGLLDICDHTDIKVVEGVPGDNEVDLVE